MSTGEVFPGSFPEQGPAAILRHIKCSFNASPDGADYADIYDTGAGCIRITPFMPHKV